MNIESLKEKLTKDFIDFYSEEGLAVVKDYCDNDDEVFSYIISDAINRSCSNADAVLLNVLKNRLNINDIDKELHAALNGKLIEIYDKKQLLNFIPFDFIRKCDLVQVLNVLQQESPQTIAVVLPYLEPDKAALLLQNLPGDVRCDVARRISTINSIEIETIKGIEKILKEKLSEVSNNEAVVSSGGIGTMVEILNLVDRSTEKQIIQGLEEEDPELAEEIKKRMFVFEDIVMLDDRAIQKILREVDSREIATALKGVDVEIQEKIFINMSKRAVSMLKEDMEYMGPVRLSDVEEAQTKILTICRYLEETGEIIVARAGDKIL